MYFWWLRSEVSYLQCRSLVPAIMELHRFRIIINLFTLSSESKGNGEILKITQLYCMPFIEEVWNCWLLFVEKQTLDQLLLLGIVLLRCRSSLTGKCMMFIEHIFLMKADSHLSMVLLCTIAQTHTEETITLYQFNLCIISCLVETLDFMLSVFCSSIFFCVCRWRSWLLLVTGTILCDALSVRCNMISSRNCLYPDFAN